jgi:type VI secretion system protein ImpK
MKAKDLPFISHDLLEHSTQEDSLPDEVEDRNGTAEDILYARIASIFPHETQSNYLQRVVNAENPLLEAASPMLHGLAIFPMQKTIRVSDGIFSELYNILVDQSSGLVHQFQWVCDRAGLPNDHALAVQYALVVAIDEAIPQMFEPECMSQLRRKSLLVQHHGESYGGEKFFHLLGRLSQNVQEHRNVLEVFYHILSLGFRGRYTIDSGKDRDLQKIRQKLLDKLSTTKLQEAAYILSPHAHIQATPSFRSWFSIPTWISWSLSVLCCLFAFGWYSYGLNQQSLQVKKNIVQLAHINISQQRLRLTDLLEREIAQGMVRVQEGLNQDVLIFTGDTMFSPGAVEVNQKVHELLQKLAIELNKVSAKIDLIGHSDNRPIKSQRIPNNQILSEQRADAVAQKLIAFGLSKERLSISGRGDLEPLNTNKTPEERALNRRVEMNLRYADS